MVNTLRKILIPLVTIIAGYTISSMFSSRMFEDRYLNPLAEQFQERVDEINDYLIHNPLTAKQYLAQKREDPVLQGLIDERIERASRVGNDKSSWEIVPTQGDTLDTRMTTRVEILDPRNFFRN